MHTFLKHSAFTLCTIGIACACRADELPNTDSVLRENGAFGFPQKDAKVLCDQPNLRFSVWNNDQYLFAQAVLWTNDNASLGKTEDNRVIGDWSELLLNVNPDAKVAPKVDRDYLLNPWPGMEGLSYQTVTDPFGTKTCIQSNTKGRGAIRYVIAADGKLVRVDTYLIPLTEISRHVGDKIRLAYWGSSPKSALTVNSAGYSRPGKSYSGARIPRSQYNAYVLANNGAEIDLSQIPDGTTDVSLGTRTTIPMPKVGETAPEISAKDWVNSKQPLTLAGLRGKVTLMEFWATWCGPCQECIPHLNELQHKYASQKFQLVSLVLEGHQTMDPFLSKHQVEYPIGLDSSSLDDYSITTIPHAFVVDQKGKIIWSGQSASPELDTAVAKALAL
ncbi:MAG TPA: TlpA disulfide reductase family protein [Verrucomicrobiae bacterium]|nr:TlpA disulfide reductase family protein [Verrucomicrobiae bacterium]